MSRSNGFLPDQQKLLDQNRFSVPNFVKIHRVYLKNSLRLHHGVFSAISVSDNLGQSRTISRKG